ncbi:MAG: hypothetical protein ABIJ16_05570 [Bacteroidota bacterium]
MKTYTACCLILIVCVVFLSKYGSSQNVAVSDDDAYTAENSAMLDVKSTSKGFLAPRLTSVQRTAIISPVAGLLVYDTTVGGYYYYNGSVWLNITTGGSTGAFWSYASPNI